MASVMAGVYYFYVILIGIVLHVQADYDHTFTSFVLPSSAHDPMKQVVHVSDFKHRLRSKRSPEDVLEKDIEFTALDNKFRMILRENYHEVLSSQFKVYVVDSDGGRKPFREFDRKEIFSGHLHGHKDSHVSAHIHFQTGLMTASIEKDKEVYSLEPIRSPDGLNTTSMVFYKTRELDSSLMKDKPVCDSIDLANETYLNEIPQEIRQRSKRSPQDNNYFLGEKVRCNMRLVADHLFLGEHHGDVKKVVAHLVSLIDRINKIYLDTEFADVEAGESSLRGFGFVVQEIIVHEAPSNEPGHYNSVQEQWLIRDLLEAFSKDRGHKWYCLSHLFTHQKFESGVLGLAFVAHTRRLIPGGVCTHPVTKGTTTYYYNTGVTTTKNSFGNPIYTRITDLITAHELGHNWGAEHDPDLVECAPRSSEGGAYLMHTYSLAGYESNNKIFSPCSKRAIANVLRSKSFSCFISKNKSFCGNGVIDEGEECDAGLIGGADTDPCCSIECKLKTGAECSDLNNLCCEKCRRKVRGSLCREGNTLDCKESSHCDGVSKDCPIESPPVADGTTCLDQGTCKSGSCIPFCESNMMMSCMCEKNVDHCIRCCRQPGLNTTCQRYRRHEGPILLKDGTPCIYGYCEKGFCRKSTQDTIKRLWGVIDEVGINVFVRFFKDNLVLAIAIFLLAIWVPASIYVKNQDDEVKQKLLRGKQRGLFPIPAAPRNGHRRNDKNGDMSASTPKRRNPPRTTRASNGSGDTIEMQGRGSSRVQPIGQPFSPVFDEVDEH